MKLKERGTALKAGVAGEELYTFAVGDNNTSTRPMKHHNL